MCELKVPVSNNSTCLCAVEVFEWWPCWRGFAGTPSHPWAWHRKQAAQLLQDQPELRQSEITERKNKPCYEQQSWDDQIFKSDKDKTLTHNVLYCSNLVLMEMEYQQCGVISESGRPKFSLWGGSAETLSSWIEGKNIPSQFLQSWKMLAGLNRATKQ